MHLWVHACHLVLGVCLSLVALGSAAQTAARSPNSTAANARAANPAARPEAVRLLQYLQALPRKRDAKVLAGQNIGHANLEVASGYANYYTRLGHSAGALPAILSVDYASDVLSAQGIAAANSYLIRHWRDGGLVTISMSPGNPWTGGDLRERSTGTFSYRDLLTPGTRANQRWRQMLDTAASGLAELRDAGVVVLWRPLHEMNGDFFWWSAGANGGWASPDEFRALWRDMFDYFSRVKKLDNLLWVYAPNYQSNEQVKPVTYYYPGDQFADVVGLDYYDNTLDRLDANDSYTSLLAIGKPMALTEVGPAFWLSAHPRGKFDTRVVIDAIRRKYPDITYFVFWHGWSSRIMDTRMGLVENLYARELLNDPWVLNLNNLDFRPRRP